MNGRNGSQRFRGPVTELALVSFLYAVNSALVFRTILRAYGTVGHHWDWNIPPTADGLAQMATIARSTWNPQHLGFFKPLMNTFLVNYALGFGGYLGLSGSVVSKALLVLVTTVSGLSMYYLVRGILKREATTRETIAERSSIPPCIPAFLSGYFYGFSPFLFNDLIGGGNPIFVAYAVAPLTLLCFRNYTRVSATFRQAILIGLTYSVVAISLHITLFLFVVMGLDAASNRRLWKDKRAFAALGTLPFVWLLLNAYWVWPFFSNVGASRVIEYQAMGEVDAVMQIILENIRLHSPSMLQAFPGTGYWTDFFSASLSPWVYPLWIGIAYSLVACIFATLLRRSPDQEMLFWSAIFLVSLVFVTGPRSLAGGLIEWLYRHSPAMAALFRSPQHFIFLPTLCLAVLLGLSFRQLLIRHSRWRYMISTMAFAAAAVWIFPFYSGNLGGWVDVFRVPQELPEIDRAITEDDPDLPRILYLPMALSPHYLQTPYQMENQGGDPSVFYSKLSSVVADLQPHAPSQKMASLLEEVFGGSVGQPELSMLLRLTGVRYIVARNDLRPDVGPLAQSWDHASVMKLLSSDSHLSLVKAGTVASLWENSGYLPRIYTSDATALLITSDPTAITSLSHDYRNHPFPLLLSPEQLRTDDPKGISERLDVLLANTTRLLLYQQNAASLALSLLPSDYRYKSSRVGGELPLTIRETIAFALFAKWQPATNPSTLTPLITSATLIPPAPGDPLTKLFTSVNDYHYFGTIAPRPGQRSMVLLKSGTHPLKDWKRTEQPDSHYDLYESALPDEVPVEYTTQSEQPKIAVYQDGQALTPTGIIAAKIRGPGSKGGQWYEVGRTKPRRVVINVPKGQQPTGNYSFAYVVPQLREEVEEFIVVPLPLLQKAATTVLALLRDPHKRIAYVFPPAERERSDRATTPAGSAGQRSTAKNETSLYVPYDEAYMIRARYSTAQQFAPPLSISTNWTQELDQWSVLPSSSVQAVKTASPSLTSRRRTQNMRPPMLFYALNWYPEERDSTRRWRWGTNNMQVLLLNPSAHTVQGTLTFRVSTNRERDLHVIVNGRLVKSVHLPSNSGVAKVITSQTPSANVSRTVPDRIEVRVDDAILLPGMNEVMLFTPQGTDRMNDLLGNGDQRQVSLQLWEDVQFEITEIKASQTGEGAAQGQSGLPATTTLKTTVDGPAAIAMSFRRDGTVHEYALLHRSFPGGIDLEEYPHFRLSLTPYSLQVQALETVFGVDTTEDGKTDSYVSASSTPSKETGEMEVSLNLLEEARDRFTDAHDKTQRNLKLLELFLIPHKRWGLDASSREKRGVYDFTIRDLRIYNDRWIVLPGPQANLGEAIVTGSGTATARSQFEGGQLQVTITPGKKRWDETVERLAVVLKDRKRLTGVVEQKDQQSIRLSKVHELEGRDAEVEMSAIAYTFRVVEQPPGGETGLAKRSAENLAELAVPVQGYPRSYPYLTIEYESPEPEAQDVAVWLQVRDANGQTQKVFAGKTLALGRRRFESATVRLHHDRQTQAFEFSLDQSFPKEYTTQGGQGRFVILKDGRPIETTWQVWQKGTEQVEIGAREPRSVILSVPLHDHPSRHEYTVRYLPPEWVTDALHAKGLKRITIDLREVLGNTRSDIVAVHLFLRGVPGAGSTGMEQGRAFTFSVKQVAFTKRVPFPTKNRDLEAAQRGAFNQPLIEIDGKPIPAQPPVNHVSLFDRNEYWLEPFKVHLTEGIHNVKILPHPTFKVGLVEVAQARNHPYDPDLGFRVPEAQETRVRFKKINPTRYIIDVEAERPFWLVLNESFYEGWRGYIRDRGKRVELKDHMLVNGFANGWYVDTNTVPGSGFQVPDQGQNGEEKAKRFQIVLEFQPQRLFEIGLLISGITLLGGMAYLGYDFAKRPRGGRGSRVRGQTPEGQ